jgi:hypothetical protein
MKEKNIMAKNYNVHIDYELWDNGYALRNISPAGELEAYELYAQLLKDDIIQTVPDFIKWVLENKPGMIYNQAEEDKSYNEEDEIREYFAEHFEGKIWDEIEPERWEFYSDWHKDVFGFRPHGIVCGVYVSPHR